jgi:hypothetical protein
MTYDGAKAVSEWRDLSNKGRHARQATGAAQPILTIAGTQSFVTFDGVNDYLAYTSGIFSDAGSVTIIAVVKVNGTPASGYGSLISEGPGLNLPFAMMFGPQRYPDTGIQWATDLYAPGGIADINGGLSLGAPEIVAARWGNWLTHKTNGNSSIRVNRANRTITAYGVAPTASDLVVFRVGAAADTLSVTSSFAAISLSELLVFNVLHSDSNVIKAETFLARKWGIA